MTAASRPWIIWVEEYGGRILMLFVYRPRYHSFLGFFGRRDKLKLVHKDGPIIFTTPREQSDLTTELVDAGVVQIPNNRRYRVALSLEDVRDIIAVSYRP